MTQSNEFGPDFAMLSVTYLIGDCILQRIDDPALLRKQTVIAEPTKLAAGRYQVRSEIKVRKAFGEAFVSGWSLPVEVTPGGTNRITVRVFEDGNAGSGAIRFILMQVRSKDPPAESPPPP